MALLKRFRKAAALQVIAILCVSSLHAEDAAARAARGATLDKIHGQQVLHFISADIKERGFGHGYFLADKIRDDFDSAVTSLPMFGAEKFEQRLLPWSKKFIWDNDSKREFDGLYEGMLAKLGEEGLKSKVLGRPYTRDDIVAFNVVADFFGPACSGFTVWDARTAGGMVVHGRNLDFPIGAKPVDDQVLFVSEPLEKNAAAPARMAWVCLGWPGLIVQFSGMNSAGVVLCLHDGMNVKSGDKGGGYEARGLLLRRILETVDPEQAEPAAAAAKMVAAKPVACGNLFHLSWPSGMAKKYNETPSAVLEFDPADQEPKIRRMDESGALVVTNHFRSLNAPVACERYTHMLDGLEAYKKASRPIGIAEARRILMAAEQPVAAHSIYFFPDSLEFQCAETKDNVMSPHVPPTAFSFKELFDKKSDHASR
jgi:hypothetical protein